jgi:HK97 family phage major capsid protein
MATEMSPDQSGAPPTRAELAEMYAEFHGAIKALQERGGDDLSGLTADEAAELTEFLDARDAVKADLDAMPDPAAVKARVTQGDAYLNQPGRRPSLGRSVKGTGEEPADSDVKGRIDAGDSAWEKAVEKGPFKSFGHFAYAVRSNGGRVRKDDGGIFGQWRDMALTGDRAIKALFGDDVKAASGMGEFIDADGGVLVPLQFSEGIWKRSLDDDVSLMSLMKPTPVSGHTLTIRARQDASRANGSRAGGVLGYWIGEGDQLTTTKPTYRTITLKLSKCIVQVVASEELLEDTSAAESEIMSAAADELRFQLGDKLVNGTGVGQPLGFLQAPCKVAISSVPAGGANTITAINIDDMWRRRSKASGQGLVWVGNQEIEGQLSFLNYATTNTAATWTYTPGSAFNGSGMPTLKGKPVYYSEFASALGTEGDLILVDPSQYAVAVKSTGVRSAVSTHLRFDYDEQVFKFVYRMDARPYWDAPLTRYKGGQTLSPVVTIASTRT